MSLASLHAAAVARLLTAEPRPCWACGAMLHTVPNPATDLFEPADHAGSRTGADADLAHLFDPAANPLGASNPYDALTKMGELMDTGHKAVGAGRAQYTPLHWRIAGEYSMLNVRLASGMPFHVHREVSDWDPARIPFTRPRPADLPFHCGWPAWLRPSGWHCRCCRIVLADETPGVELAAALERQEQDRHGDAGAGRYERDLKPDAPLNAAIPACPPLR